MQFTVEILSPAAPQGTRCTYQNEKVTIGRAVTNDICLNDVRRTVSSLHAEIRYRNESFALIDLGSTNGTTLNDSPITPNAEYPLHPQDKIKIGGFLLTFIGEPEEGLGRNRSEPVPPEHAVEESHQTGHHDEWLIYTVRRAFGVAARSQDPAREMERFIRESMCQYPKHEVRGLLSRLSEHFMASERQSDQPILDSESNVAPISQRASNERFIWRDALTLLGQTLESEVTPEAGKCLFRRLDIILQVLAQSLAAALKGRREFQREMEVEATRIFSWTPNKIKALDTAEEIAEALLDPYGTIIETELLERELREVFQDLLLHQMGLMAGLQESLRGLLEEFDPEKIQHELSRRSSDQWHRGLLARRDTKDDALAWQAFKSRHRMLSEQEVRLFERILAPYFAKGYLSAQDVKTRK